MCRRKEEIPTDIANIKSFTYFINDEEIFLVYKSFAKKADVHICLHLDHGEFC